MINPFPFSNNRTIKMTKEELQKKLDELNIGMAKKRDEIAPLREEALKIGKNASNLVLEKCTWDYRLNELEEIINKYTIK
jgi:hypothetical protein